MGNGLTGKTCLESPVAQQNLFKQKLLVIILVGQGTRVRGRNAAENLAGSTALMMMLVRT